MRSPIPGATRLQPQLQPRTVLSVPGCGHLAPGCVCGERHAAGSGTTCAPPREEGRILALPRTEEPGTAVNAASKSSPPPLGFHI